jgi:RNA polymerase sigma factor (sigma-70 family)
MSVAGGEAGQDRGLGFDVYAETPCDVKPFRAIGAAAFDQLATAQEQADPYDDLELSLVMAGALEELPPKQREILRLRYVEGLTVNEAASQLCIPVGTASTRSWHAIRKLQAYFTPPGENRPII